jgi:hypothetical protein
MTRRWFLALWIAAFAIAPACTKVYNQPPTSPTPTVTPTPTPPRSDKIEFRVLGTNVSSFVPVLIRHTDAINGLTLYSGGVPYQFDFSSLDDSIFLYIQAQASGDTSLATLQVQIYVNGRLFRDGFSQGYALDAQASGTFRR